MKGSLAKVSAFERYAMSKGHVNIMKCVCVCVCVHVCVHARAWFTMSTCIFNVFFHMHADERIQLHYTRPNEKSQARIPTKRPDGHVSGHLGPSVGVEN